MLIAITCSAEIGWDKIKVAIEMRMLIEEEERSVSSVAMINLLSDAVFIQDA